MLTTNEQQSWLPSPLTAQNCLTWRLSLRGWLQKAPLHLALPLQSAVQGQGKGLDSSTTLGPGLRQENRNKADLKAE